MFARWEAGQDASGEGGLDEADVGFAFGGEGEGESAALVVGGGLGEALSGHADGAALAVEAFEFDDPEAAGVGPGGGHGAKVYERAG